MQYQYHVWLASICSLDKQAAAFRIHNIELLSVGAQVQHRVMSGLQGLMISEYGTCMQVNWWSNRYIQGTHFIQVIMEIRTEPRHHWEQSLVCMCTVISQALSLTLTVSLIIPPFVQHFQQCNNLSLTNRAWQIYGMTDVQTSSYRQL